MYVAKDAVAKLACLCSARPRVCLRGVCCERDSPAPVCRASACLSGQDSSRVASAANSWPSARRSRGACAVWAMSHTRASRNLDFGFEVRGERQARVPVAAPAILSFSMCVLCVFIDLLRSPSLRRDGVDGVDCACGCARYIVFLYVCFNLYYTHITLPHNPKV